MLCGNRLTNLVFRTKRIVQNTICFLFLHFFIFFIIFLKKHLEWNAWILCNANPRKQRKIKKTKEQWSQREAMKHKDQENQDRSGTQNHTNYLTKCLKLTSIKRFGEDVNIMSFSRNILKTQSFFQQDT